MGKTPHEVAEFFWRSVVLAVFFSELQMAYIMLTAAQTKRGPLVATYLLTPRSKDHESNSS